MIVNNDLERLRIIARQGVMDSDSSFVEIPYPDMPMEEVLRLGAIMKNHENVVLAVLQIGAHTLRNLLLVAGAEGIPTGPIAAKAMKRWEKEVLDVMHAYERVTSRKDVADGQ